MAEGFTTQEMGYIPYSDLLDRLHARYPDVPMWRLEQIIVAENEAITGGRLRIVPAEVETGAEEMLAREQRGTDDEGEVG